MSLISKVALFESACRIGGVKFCLVESNLDKAVYLVDKNPNLTFVSAESITDDKFRFKISIFETVDTGAVAGFWSVIPNHPGLGGKFANLRKKKKSKKEIFSPFSNSIDAKTKHIKGEMKPNGLMERLTLVTTCAITSDSPEGPFKALIEHINGYLNNRDFNKLRSSLSECVDKDYGSGIMNENLRAVLSKQIVDSDVEASLSFIYDVAKQRMS